MNAKHKRGVSRRAIFVIVWVALILLILGGILLCGPSPGQTESIREVMRDGVLHDRNKVDLFGLAVNPGLISAFLVSGVLILAALLVRLIALPRFKTVPGRLQSLLEWPVEFFRKMAKGGSPERYGFLGAYLFGAGVYIFFGTLFELVGAQAVTTEGRPVTLPAPLADINGAIAMGVTSFAVILLAGLFVRGPRGALRVLKDFSLPVSMSFRLFGALLSGLLVTELVYYYVSLSFVLPVVVGVLFTLLHALIQTYVLTTLVSVFFGEAVEDKPKKSNPTKIRKEDGTI